MYDQPKLLNYHFPAVNIGSTVTRKIRVPKGAQSARVFDIHAFATTLTTAVTTSGRVQVGVSGDLDKYADFDIGILAAGAAKSFRDVDGFESFWMAAVDDVDELTVTFVAPTGGTPAGVVNVDIAIGWDGIDL